MTVGAPPDALFDGGQDWGFPPPLPGAGRRSGHLLWRRLVARAGEHASVLRIDHVMGVQRLWWVPAGAGPQDGTYVRYPRDELLAVIAAEAAATNTTIVGEDLGTVPAGDPRRAGRLGCPRPLRGAVPPRPGPPRADPGPRRSPAHEPTTCRRSPPPWPPSSPRRSSATGGCSVRHSVARSPPGSRRCSMRCSSGCPPARRASCWPTSTTCSEASNRTTCRDGSCPPRGGDDWRRRSRTCCAPTSAAGRSCSAGGHRDHDCPRHHPQSTRRAGPAPVQRGHPPPPPPLPRRPSRRCRHLVRGVGAERRCGRGARRLRRVERSGDGEPGWFRAVVGACRRRGARPVLPLRRHQPRRRADREVRPVGGGRQRAAVDGVDDRRPRSRVGRRGVDGGPRCDRRPGCADLDLRGAPRVVGSAPHARTAVRPLRRARRSAGRARAGPRLHPCGAASGHGAPVLRIVGLPVDRVLRADGALRNAAPADGADRPPAPSAASG